MMQLILLISLSIFAKDILGAELRFNKYLRKYKFGLTSSQPDASARTLIECARSCTAKGKDCLAIRYSSEGSRCQLGGNVNPNVTEDKLMSLKIIGKSCF